MLFYVGVYWFGGGALLLFLEFCKILKINGLE